MPRRIFEVMPGSEVAILPPSATVHTAAVAMKERRQCVVLAMTADLALTGLLHLRRGGDRSRSPHSLFYLMRLGASR